MPRHVETPPSPRSLLRPAPLVVGLGFAVVGVALMETGVDAGRPLLMTGLALTLIGGAFLFLKRPAPLPPPPTAAPPVDPWPEVQAVAQRLALQVNGRQAEGDHNGRRVMINCARGSRSASTRAYLSRKLDMGLRIVRGNAPGDARRRVATGDEAFDAAYSVRADEQKRAGMVVSDRLREHLVDEDVSIDDEYVEVHCKAERRAMAHAMRTAVKAAAEVDRVAVQIACARPVRDNFEVWLQFAGAHNLATASTPLSMWGEIHGVHGLAIAVRDAFENFHFELTATFPEPLERGLAVRPASAATALDRSGEPLGIPAFDKIFVVKTTDPSDTIRLIDPTVRKMLLQLRDRGLQVRADDTKLWAWVGLTRSDLQLVPETLLELSELASKVLVNSKKLRHT